MLLANIESTKDYQMRFIRYQTTPTYIPAVSQSNLRTEMDRLFDLAFPSLDNGTRRSLNGFAIDLFQNEESYIARAELPGFRKEDLTVDLEAGTLTVTAHQKTDAKEGEKTQPVQERRVSRAFALPENLNLEKIQASYENGVLTVTLPKSEAVKPRQIAVEVR